MKKFLTLFLTLCLLASFATFFAFSAMAEEELDVTVGFTSEWNDQSGDSAKQLAWIRSNATSPDGLWKYQFYTIGNGQYFDLKVCGNTFAWDANAGSDDRGFGNARVRENGKSFTPGYAADVVKMFQCPSGGTIEIQFTVTRRYDETQGNGTSFAIYVEDRLVYPEEGQGDYVTLTTQDPLTGSIRVDVAQNERVRFHVGAIGDASGDLVEMSNVITYKDVNDESTDVTTDTIEISGITNTFSGFGNNNNNNNNNSNSNTNNGGSSAGAIVAISLCVVAVIGLAAVVVVFLKRKK
ncbi:MAG: hypothetical protein J6B54_04385 [Clostridia bacterium]|nr:hypothetical protein [Clostridia bacterium]